MPSKANELAALVRDFFDVLDIIEESDEGRLFHPNFISSCRVMDTEKLKIIIPRLKELAFQWDEDEVFGRNQDYDKRI